MAGPWFITAPRLISHEAYRSPGSSWKRLEDIREAVGFESESLHQLFRRMPGWNELILSDRRGSYRLNIG